MGHEEGEEFITSVLETAVSLARASGSSFQRVFFGLYITVHAKHGAQHVNQAKHANPHVALLTTLFPTQSCVVPRRRSHTGEEAPDSGPCFDEDRNTWKVESSRRMPMARSRAELEGAAGRPSSAAGSVQR